jgi:ATP-binding cassette subfamily F protein uup
MVVQRGRGVTAPEPAAKAAPRGGRTIAMAPIAAPAPKGKLSFKQKHALETLPKDIAKLDAEIARLNQLLADPALYSRDPKAFAESSARLAAAQAAKSKAEDDWLELETLREQIEG